MLCSFIVCLPSAVFQNCICVYQSSTLGTYASPKPSHRHHHLFTKSSSTEQWSKEKKKRWGASLFSCPFFQLFRSSLLPYFSTCLPFFLLLVEVDPYCFADAGPRLWNSLPAHLRQTDINFKQFKRQLKTFLFGHLERGALWLLLNRAF